MLFRSMLELDDLGPVTNARIRRDLALSAKVITEFGVPLEPRFGLIKNLEDDHL